MYNCDENVNKTMRSKKSLDDFYAWFKKYNDTYKKTSDSTSDVNFDVNSTPNCEARLLVWEKECIVSFMIINNNENYSTLYISTPGRIVYNKVRNLG